MSDLNDKQITDIANFHHVGRDTNGMRLFTDYSLLAFARAILASRTQPEATAPAPIPGLPFADLATPIKEFEARKAAALASSANALSAGDSEKLTEVAVKAYTQFAAKASYLRHPEVPYMGTAKGDHPDRWKERFDKAAMRSVVCAILQSQKGGSHG